MLSYRFEAHFKTIVPQCVTHFHGSHLKDIIFVIKMVASFSKNLSIYAGCFLLWRPPPFCTVVFFSRTTTVFSMIEFFVFIL